jgi:hypothetical protein
VKHSLKARHYGRYVDDMVLFHEDPAVLNAWYMQMDQFLKSTLGLHLHPGKKHLNRADTGIDFTGFIIKPGRTYLRQTSLSACKRKIRAWERKGSPVDPETLEQLSQSLNSYPKGRFADHCGGCAEHDRRQQPQNRRRRVRRARHPLPGCRSPKRPRCAVAYAWAHRF